ncbi:collagen-like protein [Sinorhizobium medicae]|nr:collagen-like protein [Sinorhizobium medicae]MDX0580094.1 collagen-like protein [Sinorhizobium medicae]MDX0783676.1 collagen-like protein [Sinorhizobium medicae]
MAGDRFNEILHFLGTRFAEERDRVSNAVAAVIAELRAEQKTIVLDLSERVAAVRDGMPGAQGERGEQGEKGDPGPPGKDGNDGAPGKDGADGREGPPGDNGERGEKGERGERGEPGLQGDPGPQGETGPTGPQGKKGKRGERGEPGTPGKDGNDGAPGKDGADGKEGPPGDNGERGEKGERGERGAQGEKGERGEKGLQGEMGPRGLRGETGPPGPRGEKGERGEKGTFEQPSEWTDGSVFHSGQLVHCDGSTFCARRDTARRPPHDDWSPVALKGKDAQAGEARGLYDSKAGYLKLDRVAFDGSEWIARRDDPGPLPGEDWMLAAKAGSRGKPGERGPPGAKGDPGIGVKGGTCDGFTLRLTLDDGRAVIVDLAPAFDRYHQERGA